MRNFVLEYIRQWNRERERYWEGEEGGFLEGKRLRDGCVLRETVSGGI
jgi:hypothetical protein